MSGTDCIVKFAVDAEAVRADAAITTAVAAEATARDSAISTAVAAEATARAAAVTSEASARASADATEAAARSLADAGLDRRINRHAVSPLVDVAGAFPLEDLGNPVVDSSGNVLRADRGSQHIMTNARVMGVLTLDSPGALNRFGPMVSVPGLGDVVDGQVNPTGYLIAAKILNADGVEADYRAVDGFLVPAAETGASIAASTYSTGSAAGNRLPFSTWNNDADIVWMFLILGQSLACGGNGNSSDTPISTTAVYPDYVLMFGEKDAAGGWVRPDGRLVDRFVPLIEQLDGNPSDNGTTKETIASGFANTLFEAINTQTGFSPTILMAVAAHGGAAYEYIARGRPYYTEGLRLVSEAVRIAKAQGKRVVCNVLVQHGEADYATGRQRYAAALNQFHANLSEDIVRVTGQDERVRMFVAQCNRGANNSTGKNYRDPDTPTAVLDAADRNPLIHATTGLYATPIDGSGSAGLGAHPSCLGYRQQGEMVGMQVWEEMAHIGLNPLRIVSALRYGADKIIVRCSDLVYVDASGSIVGTTGLTANAGFWFQDGSGTAYTVSAVANVNDLTFASATNGTTRTLQLTLSGPPSGTAWELFYATNCTDPGGTSNAGNATGARGLIRSPSPWSFDTNTSDVAIPFTSPADGDAYRYRWLAVDALPVHGV